MQRAMGSPSRLKRNDSPPLRDCRRGMLQSAAEKLGAFHKQQAKVKASKKVVRIASA
jgi:hypothetical protein